MRKIIISLFITLLFGAACKKDKTADFVNDFTPTLLEKANTKYDGNYYPMYMYLNWYWNDKLSSTGEFITGVESYSMDDSDNTGGYMSVLDSGNISLTSGNYVVLTTYETNCMRYFQVNDTAIFIRAIRMYDSDELVEVKNPLYIKKPLIVGDKWQTQPDIDLNSLTKKFSMFGVSGINVKINCLMFVLGKENINLNNMTVPTVALEERVEMTGSIIFTDFYEGTLNLSATADIKLNLEKDTGIIRQVSVINENASGNLQVAGKRGGDVKLNMTIDQSALLSYFYVNKRIDTAESKKIHVSDELKGNKSVDKQLNTVTKLFSVIRKLTMP